MKNTLKPDELSNDELAGRLHQSAALADAAGKRLRGDALRIAELEAQLDALKQKEPIKITEEMALSFHRSMSDGSIGQDDLDEIMVGLSAAFANIEMQAAPVMRELSDERDGLIAHNAWLKADRDNIQKQNDALRAFLRSSDGGYQPIDGCTSGKLNPPPRDPNAASRTAGQDKRDAPVRQLTDEESGEIAYHKGRGAYEVYQLKAGNRNFTLFGELPKSGQAYWIARAAAGEQEGGE